MWTTTQVALAARGVVHHLQYADNSPVTYRDVLHLWQNDEAFRTYFTQLLAASPIAAYRWETPPVTKATLDRPFEFVLLPCPGLERRPDRAAFAEHYGKRKLVVAFDNLGGDATLVVPTPQADDSAYGHLAAFVRHAPQDQQHVLWQEVARAMERRVGEKPVWLSTAGMGVAWLHVRLDSRPKYYGHRPYTQFDPPAGPS
jgi:hypothetical protein